MDNLNDLQWIDLSHNHLVDLDYGFEEIPHLKTLYLHCNFLFDFNTLEKLKLLKELKNMTIHGNPLTSVPNFRILTISILT
jgi:Leucine-rich repeat (LRR) protein